MNFKLIFIHIKIKKHHLRIEELLLRKRKKQQKEKLLLRKRKKQLREEKDNHFFVEKT